MINCSISILLSYLMLTYTISSIYYLINTYDIGTPFKNSLTKNQLLIKKKAVNQRKNIFYQGLIIGLLICIIFRPFHDC